MNVYTLPQDEGFYQVEVSRCLVLFLRLNIIKTNYIPINLSCAYVQPHRAASCLPHRMLFIYISSCF